MSEVLDEAERLAQALPDVSQDEQKREVLLHVHERYTRRFLSDNERIWSTAKLFVPLSLGAFAAFGTVGSPTIFQLLCFAIPSIMLILIWNFVADGHRAFQEKNLARVIAIEMALGIGGCSNTMSFHRARLESASRLRVRTARRFFTWAIAGAWTALLLALVVPVVRMAVGLDREEHRPESIHGAPADDR